MYNYKRATGLLACVLVSACAQRVLPPVASAGSAQQVNVGSFVRLDATGSSDAQRRPLTFDWSFAARPPGSQAALADAQTPTPSFTADVAGDFALQVVVSNSILTSQATVTVTASPCGGNAPDVRSIKLDRDRVVIGNTVLLSAEVGDADNTPACGNLGQALSFAWTLIAQPPASRAVLNNARSEAPSLRADAPGAYVVRLVVTDSTARASLPKDLGFTVDDCGMNAPAVSATATPAIVKPTATVQLAATPTDADIACGVPESFTYSWKVESRPQGSTAPISDPASARPTFVPDRPGDYQLSVTATDHTRLTSKPALVKVTATACGEIAPSIDSISLLGGGAVGSVLALGAAVSDANCLANGAITYAWELLVKPAASGATIDDPAAATARLIPDAAGSYQLALTVTDSVGLSSPAAYRTVAVQPCGQAPLGDTSITITAQDPVPPLQQGPGVHLGALVTLAAAAQDPNSCGVFPVTPYAYRWFLVSAPAGSQAQLSSATEAAPTLSPDLPGSYAFGVVVTDALGNKAAAAYASFTTSLCGFQAPDVVPAVSAGPYHRGTVVSLAGAASDGDNSITCGSLGQTLSYAWQLVVQPAGSNAVLANPGAPMPGFTVDAPGRYTAQVVVTDSTGRASPPRTISITADGCGGAQPTLAASATPASTDPFQAVQLAATPGDDDNSAACGGGVTFAYQWQVDARPAGSSALLSDPTASNPVFTPDLPGAYQFSVVATASNGLVTPRAFTHALVSSACSLTDPSVDAISGAGAAGAVGARFALSAAVSDGNCLANGVYTYQWSLAGPGGSTAKLDDAGLPAPAFLPDLPGDYLVNLVVTDSQGRVSPAASQRFSMYPCGSAPPSVAPSATVAGTPATSANLFVGTQALLHANLTDPNQCGLYPTTPVAYRWEIASAPRGSAAQITSGSLADAAFIPDVQGSYQLSVSAIDALGNSSAPAYLALTTSQCGANAPVAALRASAGPYLAGTVVGLSAQVSDADVTLCGLPVTFAYQWQLVAVPAGSAAHLNDAGAATPSFSIDLDGDYTARLIVSASSGVTSAAQTITVRAQPCGAATPTVTASVSPATTDPQKPVTLSAVATDADNDAKGCNLGQAISYAWSMKSRPPASSAVLSDLTRADESFTPDLPGSYQFAVVATDATGRASAPALVTLVVAADCTLVAPAIGPLSSTGTRQRGQRLTLAAQTSDANCLAADPLTYRWSLQTPAGSSASLDGAQLAAPSFLADLAGVYTAQLVVTDSRGRSSQPASEQITVVGCTPATLTAAPSASVGTAPATAANFFVGTLATLHANAVDPASCGALPVGPTTYAWAILASPAGSRAQLSSASASDPLFAPDVAGSYTFVVTAADALGNSSAATLLTLSTSLCGTHAPSASAAASPAVTDPRKLVTLTAAATDADNDQTCNLGQTFTYAWSLVGRPAGSTAQLDAATGAQTSFTPDRPGAWRFSVVVTDSTGKSSPAAAVDVSVNAFPPPGAPTGLTATGGASISLSWTAPGGASSFVVRRGTQDQGPYPVSFTASGSTFVDPSAETGVLYYYVVAAVGEGGTGANSNQASTIALLPPAGLTATASGRGAITLSWTGAAGANAYRVLRSDDGGATFARIDTAADPLRSYSDSGLQSGKKYVYELVSLRGPAASAASAPATATTRLPAPAVLTSSGVGPIALAWSAVPGVSTYRILRGPQSGAEIAYDQSSGPSYSDSNLSPSSSYFYVVHAVTADAESGDSNEVTASTLGPPSQIGFLVQPSDVSPGNAIVAPVQVAILDSRGRVVPTASAQVTVALANNTAGASLTGTKTVATTGGVASFNDLEVDQLGLGYTMSASAPGYATVQSTTFNGTVIANGGFEAGLTGWVASCGTTMTDDAVHGSVFYGQMFGQCLSQVGLINVDNTSSLRVRMDLKLGTGFRGGGPVTLTITSGTPPGYDQVTVGQHVFQPSSALVESNALNDTTQLPYGAWYSFTSDDIKPLLPAGSTSVRIALGGPTQCCGRGVALIDNVKLVIGDDAPPAPSATETDSGGGMPLVASFAGTPNVAAGSLRGVSWDFGDGSINFNQPRPSTTSTEASASFAYQRPGSYWASFTAQDGFGAARTALLPLQATDALTAAIGLSSGTGPAPLGVAFSDTGTQSTDQDQLSYAWSFGDGGTSTAAAPSHSYLSPGTYKVSLQVTDPFGSTASDSTLVVVTDPSGAPLADTSFDDGTAGWINNCGSVTTDDAVHGQVFLGQMFGPCLSQVAAIDTSKVSSLRLRVDVKLGTGFRGGAPLSLSLSTGSTQPYNQVLLGQHTFSPSGTFVEANGINDTTQLPYGTWYSFTSDELIGLPQLAGAQFLTVSLGGPTGCCGRAVAMIDNVRLVVGDTSLPTAAASIVSTNASLPLIVSFAGEGAAPAGLASTTWDFGDGAANLFSNYHPGSSSTESSPVFTYANQGTYNASFTVVDALGAARSSLVQITAVAPPLTAQIGVDLATGPAPLRLNFKDLGVVEGGLTYAWTFGDGGTSSLRDPQYVFSAPGTYQVNLTVQDPFGNSAHDSYLVVATDPSGAPLADIGFDNGTTGWINNCGSVTTDDAVHGQVFLGQMFGPCLSQVAAIDTTKVSSLRVRVDVKLGTGFRGGAPLSLSLSTGATQPYNQVLLGQHTFAPSGAFVEANGINDTTQLPYGTWASYTSDELIDLPQLAGAQFLTVTLGGPTGCCGRAVALVDNLRLVVGDATVPTATASIASTNDSLPLVVNFASTESTSAALATTTWDFGDGSTNLFSSYHPGTTSSLLNPVFTYTGIATYNASFTVSDALGAARSAFVQTVVTDSITAHITESVASGAAPLSVTFGDSGSPATSTNPLTYAWNFGDGSTSTEASPRHTFLSQGTFLVSLRVTDSLGASATDSFDIVVLGIRAATSFALTGLPSSAGTGAPLGFTLSALDANGNVAPTYQGKVHFTSSDPLALLPADVTFGSNDGGQLVLPAAALSFGTAGAQTVTATDTTDDLLRGTSAPVVVGP